MAYFTYAGTGLLTVFQIVSGFALYAPTSESWFPQLFTWVVPLFGSEFTLRIFHYAILWAFVVFTTIHVYLTFYHDYVEGHGVLSSIVGGWKFMEKHQAAAEHATGISAFPELKEKAPPAKPRPMTLLDSTLVGEPCVAAPAAAGRARVLVLGVGNVLMGDEGVGVHVLRTLELEPEIPGVRLLDGGTGGVNLLTEFDGVAVIILIDATYDGRPAGTVTHLQPARVADLPRGLGAHDFGLKDLFAAAA
eukprot:gene56842-77906_t